MTTATCITITRLALVPVFAALAIYYSLSIPNGANEPLRYAATVVYIIAAASDGLDGYLARKLGQTSNLGAFLDPIADKTLLLTGITVLTLFPWGENDWRIPLWFTALVFLRDNIILWGVFTLYHFNKKAGSQISSGVEVPMRPLLSGKICTVLQIVTLGWVMLKWIPLSPAIPATITSIFLVWSGVQYIRMGISLLPSNRLSS